MKLSVSEYRAKYYIPYINGIRLYHCMEADDTLGYAICGMKEMDDSDQSWELYKLVDETQEDSLMMRFLIKMHGRIEFVKTHGRQ